MTNWFGYLLLAGILFSCGLPALPPGWKLGSDGLRLIGALLLALAAGFTCWPAVSPDAAPGAGASIG